MTSKRKLKTIIEQRRKLFRKKPEAAIYRPAVVTEWTNGLRAESRIRDHVIVSDYPVPAGGTDTAANPMEMLLAALGSCISAVYVEYAAMLDMKLDAVTVELAGDIDLRGLFNVEPVPFSGFAGIEYTVTIKTAEPEDTVDQLIELAENHCPVSDSLERIVLVKARVNVETTAS